MLSWNKSVIGHLAIQMSNPNGKETIWTKWIKHYKLAHADFLQVSCKAADSPWWKAILLMRDVLKERLPDFSTQLIHLPGKTITQTIYACLVPKGEVVPWYTQVWMNFVTPRMSFLYWLVVL